MLEMYGWSKTESKHNFRTLFKSKHRRVDSLWV